MEFIVPITFQIDPQKIIPWLSKKDKDSSLVLLDFKANVASIDDNESIRIDLDVVFNPKPIRRGTLQRYDYYVGSTGAEISLTINDGTIDSFTPEVKIDVDYSNTVGENRKSNVSLSPSMEVTQGTSKVKANIGTFAKESAEHSNFSASFKSSERILVPSIIGNTIKWNLNLPRGEKAVSDFLNGNLYLFAQCNWSNNEKSGIVNLRPSDVLFFDSERRPLSNLQSLLMAFVMWSKNKYLSNKDGFQISFKELCEDESN
jgi:hypothetical protein